MEKLIVFLAGLWVTDAIFIAFPQGGGNYVSIVFAGYILLTLWAMVIGLMLNKTC